MTKFTPVNRVCRNCPRKFLATREQHYFHSEECRKEYHRHGGVNYSRIREDLKRDLRPMIQQDIQRAFNGRHKPEEALLTTG